jgi:AcrR family transcriptional regulator
MAIDPKRNRATSPALSARSKRSAVLTAATHQFAHHGYDPTKWADVAEEVGVGQTALYHYFASKAHCLFTIMAEALRDYRDHFDQTRREHDNHVDVLVAAIRYIFELDETGVLRYRVLQAEISWLDKDYPGSRKERATLAEARDYARDLNRDWTRFFDDGMRAGAFPPQNPYLLAHDVLGLCTSIFQWYRPGSEVSLQELADVVTSHVLAIVLHGHTARARVADDEKLPRLAAG